MEKTAGYLRAGIYTDNSGKNDVLSKNSWKELAR